MHLGRYEFVNGDVYVGEFRNGMQDGHGSYSASDHSTCCEGRLRTQAPRVSDDGPELAVLMRPGAGWASCHVHCHYVAVYEGGWIKGQKHGHGLCVYSDGSRFEGVYARDQVRFPPVPVPRSLCRVSSGLLEIHAFCVRTDR